MDRLTRKELKSDRFQLEVQHSVEFLGEHRQQMVRWGGIALGVLVVAIGIYLYRSHEHSVRQAELREAMRIQSSSVGPNQSEYIVTFPTADARYKAIEQAMGNIARKYSGYDEGYIAEYFLAATLADEGKIDEAEKHFKTASEAGTSAYASVAKLSWRKFTQRRASWPTVKSSSNP